MTLITVLQKTGGLLNTPDSVFKWLPASPPTPYSPDPALPWLCHRVSIAPSSFPPISCNTQHPLTIGREIFPQVFSVQVSPTAQGCTDPRPWWHSFGHTQALLGANTPCPLIFPQQCSRNVSPAHDSTQCSGAVSEPFLLQQQYQSCFTLIRSFSRKENLPLSDLF